MSANNPIISWGMAHFLSLNLNILTEYNQSIPVKNWKNFRLLLSRRPRLLQKALCLCYLNLTLPGQAREHRGQSCKALSLNRIVA